MKRKILSIFLMVFMITSMLPTGVWAEKAYENGLCQHHTEHTEDCGYAEAVEDMICGYECGICAEMTEEVQMMPFAFSGAAGGTGTETDPYIISSLEELEAFRDYVDQRNTGEGEHFKLSTNIDMSGKYGPGKSAWGAIGYTDSAYYYPKNIEFKGTFDGGGNRITGLYTDYNRTGDFCSATLFANVGTEGTVKNLAVTGEINGYRRAGGIVGENYGTIENCSFEGTVNVNYQGNGGIVGGNGGTVRGCTFDGTINTKDSWTGGISGSGSGLIENCISKGTINCTGGNQIGGISGANGNIKNCCSECDINAVGGQIGGIAGYASGTIENCYNTGSVSSTQTSYPNYDYGTGGIVGHANGVTIRNCYNRGDVSCPIYSGGIVGAQRTAHSLSISNCYYLDTSATGGLNGGDVEGGAEVRTAEGFAAGEVAWLLQNPEKVDSSFTAQIGQAWGQEIGSDDFPLLTTENAIRVWRITFTAQSQNIDETEYVNTGGNVTLPPLPENADWYVDGTPFTGNNITKDMDAIASKRILFGGESEMIPLEITYGQGGTLDLKNYIAYEDGEDVSGKFEYSITSDGGIASATVAEDGILTIPADADANEKGYTMTITAREKEPHIVTLSVDDYGKEDVTLTVKVVINKAALTADMYTFKAADDLVYDAGDKPASVTENSGYIGVGSIITLKYYKDGSAEEMPAPPTEAGTYTVRIDVTEGQNYRGAADLTDLSWTFEISYLDVPAVPYTVSGTYTDADGVIWIKDGETATIAPAADHTIARSLNGTYEENLSVDSWISGDEIYLKDIQGHMTDGISVTEDIRLDGEAPTGSITIKDREPWKTFINKITFGLCYKDAQTATITSSDGDGSGVASTEYYLSAEGLTAEEAAAISGWQSYENSVGLEKDGKYVVYVKITDNLGYVTYISSNGIVIYTDAVAGTTAIEYTKTTKTDVTAQVTLNGNTVNRIMCDGKELTSERDYTAAADGTITFKGDWLDGIAADQHTLTISYKPQGEVYVEGDEPATTSITLTVFRVDQVALAITDPGIVCYKDTFTLAATGGSGTGKVIWKVVSGNATIDEETGKVTITGLDEVKISATKAEDENYNETSAEITFTVQPKEVTATVEVIGGPFIYADGEEITPEVIVRDGDTIIPASEYTVTYSENTEAGTATVTITDNEGGNYIVTGTTTFTIDPITPEMPSGPEPTNAAAATGDNANITLWMVLILLSLAATMTMLFLQKKMKLFGFSGRHTR